MDRLALNRLGTFLFESDIYVTTRIGHIERKCRSRSASRSDTIYPANSHHLLLISNHEECSRMMLANGTLSF